MTEQKFKADFMALVVAKLHSPDPEFVAAKMSVYWECLKEIPEELWQRAVDHCLRHGDFFPSIEELGEAAMGEHWDYNPRAGSAGSKKIPWETVLRRRIAQDMLKKIEQKNPTRAITFTEKSQAAEKT